MPSIYLSFENEFHMPVIFQSYSSHIPVIFQSYEGPFHITGLWHACDWNFQLLGIPDVIILQFNRSSILSFDEHLPQAFLNCPSRDSRHHSEELRPKDRQLYLTVQVALASLELATDHQNHNRFPRNIDFNCSQWLNCQGEQTLWTGLVTVPLQFEISILNIMEAMESDLHETVVDLTTELFEILDDLN
jgi:hypothetical protein